MTGHYWTEQWGGKSSEKKGGEIESSSEGRSGSRSRDRERKPIRTPVNRPKPFVLKPYSGDGTFGLTINISSQ